MPSAKLTLARLESLEQRVAELEARLQGEQP